uniref:Uncharacterized protein n=1 Tax=Cucumis melo TaxID=3656 RepID=A0A9I9E0X3_CUCME
MNRSSRTDYLYITVGGTLSNAGISGQSFRYGPQRLTNRRRSVSVDDGGRTEMEIWVFMSLSSRRTEAETNGKLTKKLKFENSEVVSGRLKLKPGGNYVTFEDEQWSTAEWRTKQSFPADDCRLVGGRAAAATNRLGL